MRGSIQLCSCSAFCLFGASDVGWTQRQRGLHLQAGFRPGSVIVQCLCRSFLGTAARAVNCTCGVKACTAVARSENSSAAVPPAEKHIPVCARLCGTVSLCWRIPCGSPVQMM